MSARVQDQAFGTVDVAFYPEAVKHPLHVAGKSRFLIHFMGLGRQFLCRLRATGIIFQQAISALAQSLFL